MSVKNNETRLKEIAAFSDEKRAIYCFNEIAKNREIWVLTDEHGCVMLNTEEEDCVPIWPNEAFAQAWATNEWQDCKPESVSLNKWFSRWTQGLIDDDLSLVVFPSSEEQGLIYYPEELEQAIKKVN